MVAIDFTIVVTFLGCWRHGKSGWCAAFSFSHEPDVIHLHFA